jgi:DNA replication protein DnaC
MIKQIDYLDKRKSEKLISCTSNVKHKSCLLLMLDCGLRVSECVTLKYSNFDFRNKTVTVTSLKKRDEVHTRTIPISDRLYDALAEYIRTQTKKTADDYLFTGIDGKNHLTRKALNRVCDRFKEKYPEFDNLHPHALRHTFATHHLSNGTELHNIKEMLGHKKYDTTLIYAHTPIEILRKNIDTVTSEKLNFWDKIKSLFVTKNRPTIINLSNDINNFVIGRNSEIQNIIDLVNKNVNVILIGGIGAGKTHLLKQITPSKKILRFDDFADIKNTLIQCLLYLYKNDKEHVFEMLYGGYDLAKLEHHLQKDSITNLCKEIIKTTQKHEYILVIDNCDRITPKGIKALEELKDHFTILTTAREVPVTKSSFLWNFEIIKLENLARHHSIELIHKLAYDLDIEDVELFRNHIYEQSNGNPRVIFELIDRYRKEMVVTSDIVRNIRHYGSMREYDMSLAVLIVLGGLAILRYLSNEVGDESLRFIGGCAMVLLIISRYFFSFTKRKFI